MTHVSVIANYGVFDYDSLLHRTVFHARTNVSRRKPGYLDARLALQQHTVAIFEQPLRIEAHDVPVTIKSGVACRGSGSQDAQTLVQNAEAGVRQAKAVS